MGLPGLDQALNISAAVGNGNLLIESPGFVDLAPDHARLNSVDHRIVPQHLQGQHSCRDLVAGEKILLLLFAIREIDKITAFQAADVHLKRQLVLARGPGNPKQHHSLVFADNLIDIFTIRA